MKSGLRNKKAIYITQSGIIAALYVVLTYISAALSLSSGAIQVRFSEALCILPVFTPAAVPGLFLGCLIANALSGCIIWDVIFGSLATLLGALGTYALRKKKWLAFLPPILCNTIVVPLVLAYFYHIEESLPILFLTVGIGEVISCFGIGQGVVPIAKQVFDGSKA